jgi:5'-3' exonuclease
MTPVRRRMMLLDSASMYFRAFFGVPDSITAPDGTPVNAVRGFLDMIAFLVGGQHRPTHLVACLDADWRPAWRVSAVPAYKAQRLAPGSNQIEIVPPALETQIPVIEAVLDALGIARIGVAGYEADDVIGTLAAHASMPVDVVSGDRDLFQVVDDVRSVRVLYIGRGVRRLEVVDDAVVRRKYGVPAAGYADFALLRGDPSDGLVGVAGVGEKTAASLIDGYGSVQGLLVAIDDPASGLAPGLRMKLGAAKDYMIAAQPVVRVATDLAIPSHDAALPTKPADPTALVELSDRWGLDGSLNRVLTALAP